MGPAAFGLRAVSFDAAGTLIHPVRPVAELYAGAAARHGARVDPQDVHERFRRAFSAAPPLAFPGAPQEQLRDRERAWWHAVVGEVFAGIPVDGFDALFDDLFALFARPSTWRLDPDALVLLRTLRARGLRILVVSNFDARVRGILDGLGITPLIDRITLSSEVGAAKPDPGIFAAALDAAGLRSAEVLHVGDTVAEDLVGARDAGLRVLLVGGPALAAAGAPTVPRLGDVADWIARVAP
jgi:putative hydrolase of the HAD superfamily